MSKIVLLNEVSPTDGFQPGEIVISSLSRNTGKTSMVGEVMRLRGCGCCATGYQQCLNCDWISQHQEKNCLNCGYSTWKGSTFEAWDEQRKSDWRAHREVE